MSVRFHYNEFLKIEVEKKKCSTQMSCFRKLNCTSQKELGHLHCDCGINSMRISLYINKTEFVWTRKCPIAVIHNIDIWARNLHEIYRAAPLFIMRVMRKCIWTVFFNLRKKRQWKNKLKREVSIDTLFFIRFLQKICQHQFECLLIV